MMRNFLENLRYRTAQFMYGRYGNDRLNYVLVIAAMVLTLIDSIFGLYVLSLLSMAALVFVCVRCFSRDIARRRSELDRYLVWEGKAKNWLSVRRKMWRDRATHRYFKCPTCGAYLKVPKHKGSIEINCPKCGGKLTRKT